MQAYVARLRISKKIALFNRTVRRLLRRRWLVAIVVLLQVWYLIDFINWVQFKVTVYDIDAETEEELATSENDYDFRVSLCALTRVRNEEREVLEWVAYHTIMGYSRFFITDDCSTDNTTAILNAMAKVNPNITIFNNDRCDQKPDETRLLQRMFEVAKPQCEYTSVFDIDEFVSKQTDLWKGSLTSYLVQSESPCTRLLWWLMGNDGRMTQPKGLLIESYLHGKNHPCHMKSICRTDVIRKYAFSIWPSEFIAKYRYLDSWLKYWWAYDHEVRMIRLPSGYVTEAPSWPFFLKHYYVKDLEDYMGGRGARAVNSNGQPNPFYRSYNRWAYYNISDPTIAAPFTASMVSKTASEMTKYTSKPWWPTLPPKPPSPPFPWIRP